MGAGTLAVRGAISNPTAEEEMQMKTFPSSWLLTAWLLPATALGWGFDGHRRLAAHLQDPLPAGSCLKQWITLNQSSAFQGHAVEPDQWRQTGDPHYDPAEWSRHYLEIDYFSPIAAYPREWAAAQAAFGPYAEKNGQVPWRVEEYYAKLIAAFRAKNSALILLTLAHFSHYVTDAFSLLHDTRNFDPDGLHSRWESDMLSVKANLEGITAASGGYLGTVGRADPRNNIFDIVMVGNGLVAELIAADQRTAAMSNRMPAFYDAVKDLTARRWGDALTLAASMIAGAWIDAGSPRLGGMTADCVATLPQGEIVLRGYPVPGGFTGTKAAGADAGTAPVPDPSAPAEPEPIPEPKSGGCGGSTAALAWPFLGVGLVAGLRKRVRR